MPDREAPVSLIQNTFSAGEIAPAAYGRTDLAKFHQSAAVMRNFFVDYKGGASSRAGTQYMGQASSAGAVRLQPFQFSSTIGQTYMLVFSDTKLAFIKNPGGPCFPNSSNAGFIQSGGSQYSITTPYLAADLPYLHFSQVADQMWITRHGYARRVLSRITDTNWTLTTVAATLPISAPTISSITITALPAGSPDPVNTSYQYVVSSVDAEGNESFPSGFALLTGGINIATTQGTVSIFWGAVTGAVYYKVYKAIPAPGGKVPGLDAAMGFVGFAYGPSFTDSNIVPDFTRTPITFDDPFVPGKISGYAISASSADWPVNATTLNVTDGTGTGAVLIPVLSNNTVGGVGSIIGIFIKSPGQGYTAPTVAAAGGGTTFTATLSISATTGMDPDVVGLFQQRQIYASTLNFPSTLWGSRPGKFADFTSSNPVIDNDSYAFTIASQQVSDILWLQSMPGGLVIGTNSGIVQLTGGSSSAANPSVVTPSNAVIVPQSYYGSADIQPVVINYDIIYVQAGGSYIRDLQYNFFVNIYTGTDVTVLSSHLFYPHTLLALAYEDSPKKIIWVVRDDGVLLSLTYLKEQEMLGWARHDTNGIVAGAAVVREGNVDALYLVVNRAGTNFIERMCDRQYNSIEDAWCLDGALSTVANWKPAATLAASGTTGIITLTAGIASFTAPDVGKVIRSQAGAKATITGFTDTTHVTVSVDSAFGPWPSLLGAFPGLWRVDPVVSVISGLTHLNGFQVYALADGVVQGPFTVVAGAITLTTPASNIVVGLRYECQLQQLYLDTAGEPTVQGRRKKIAAASIRVKDAARVKYGTQFDRLQEWRLGVSSTDPKQYWPDLTPAGIGLTFGDQRLILDPSFNVQGSVCIQQDLPLPVTVLAIISEVAQGDTA